MATQNALLLKNGAQEHQGSRVHSRYNRPPAQVAQLDLRAEVFYLQKTCTIAASGAVMLGTRELRDNRSPIEDGWLCRMLAFPP